MARPAGVIINPMAITATRTVIKRIAKRYMLCASIYLRRCQPCQPGGGRKRIINAVRRNAAMPDLISAETRTIICGKWRRKRRRGKCACWLSPANIAGVNCLAAANGKPRSGCAQPNAGQAGNGGCPARRPTARPGAAARPPRPGPAAPGPAQARPRSTPAPVPVAPGPGPVTPAPMPGNQPNIGA